MNEKNYSGPDRRGLKVDSLELLIEKIEKLFDLKFDTLEKRFDRLELDTKGDMANLRKSLEGLFNSSDARNRADHAEIEGRIAKLETRINDLENAPAKKAAEVQTGFFKKGRDVIGGAIWAGLVGVFIWLLVTYGQRVL
jgi:ABC-type phosphate transport system auxiliary subunit